MITRFKFFIFITFFLLQMGNIAFAQSVMSIEPGNISFGDIWSHISYTRTLRITNNENANIEILSFDFTGANSSLFSFVTNPNLPMTLAPSQSVELEVRFVSNTAGTKNGMLNINHNGSPSTIVSLSANVVGISVDITPNVIDFGSVPVGSQSENRMVTVTNTGINNITITGISIIGGDAGSFVITPFLVTLNPGQNQNISVVFRPTSADGKEATLSIMITIESFHSTWDVSLIGNVTAVGTPVISINQNSIYFGTTPYGESTTPVALRITNYGNEPLVISFSITGDVFRLFNGETEITIDPFNSYDLYVQFSPTVAQYYTGTLTLTHNASGSPTNISLSGTGGAPQISINPTIINFGCISAGSLLRDIVRITNTGIAPLEISTFITGGVFTLQNNENTITLLQGEYYDLYVQFSPTTEGTYTGYVMLEHNADNSPTPTIIPLNGECPSSSSSGAPNINVYPFPEINFGDILIGTVNDIMVRITNTGTTPLIVNSVPIEGEDRESYVLIGVTLPIIIPAGDSRSFMVRYQPLAENRRSNRITTLTINHNVTGRSPIVTNLIGLSYVNYSIQPYSIDFGTVQVGSQIDTAIYVTNMSPINTILYGNSGYRNSEEANYSFIITPPLPFSLPLIVDETQRIPVSFKPTLRGPLEYELVIGGESGGGGDIYRFTGIGIDEKPTIGVDPTNINFGNVNVGGYAQLVVKITNSGNVPIEISTSITGGVFTLPNNENTITIPESGYYYFYVQFSPNETMSYSGSLTLTHNVGGLLSIIPLSGLGILSGLAGIVGVVPEIDFGDVFLGMAKDTFTIINNGNVALTINNAQIVGTNAGDFELEVISSITIPAGGSKNFTLKFQPNSFGKKTAIIEIYHNNSLVPSPLYVTLLGTGILPNIPIIKIEPESIEFSNVLVGNLSEQQYVRITNTGTATLDISSLDISSSVFSLPNGESSIELDTGEYHDLYVQFLPTDVADYSGDLTLEHNATSGLSSVHLIGKGIIVSADVIPNVINFGDVQFGSQSDSAVYVTNIGSIDIDITRVNITSGDIGSFASSFVPVTLVSGESQRISVSFIPISLGFKQATLNITTSVGALTVQLTGNGVGMPIIEINPTSIDFDDVIVGSSLLRSVKITNDGTADLEITRVTITGDFILPNGENNNQSPMILEIGEHYTLDVQFVPTTTGLRQGTITLEHNAEEDNGSSKIALTGTGTSLGAPGITITSTTPLNFGDVIVNNFSSTENITIQNDGTADLKITKVSIGGDFTFPGNENTEVSTQSPIIVEVGGSHTIKVQFRPTIRGTRTGTVTLTHNAEGGSRTIELIGRGVQPSITFIQAVNFGDVTINTPTTRNITIQNGGNADLVITEISIDGIGFTLSNVPSQITVASGVPRTITVQFLPTAVGSYEGTVTLKHNASENDGLSNVILTGNGIEDLTPGIEIIPNPLIFGDVIINSPKTENITIQNSGTANLVISKVTINGTGFTLSGVSTPINIVAGGSCIIAVQFLPTVAGSHTGTVTFYHNSTDSLSNVQLIGNGMPLSTIGITVTPNPLNFGDVLANSSRTENITIQNNGIANLVISGVSISGDVFILQNITTPITITAGERITVAIHFSSTATIGSYIDTLTLWHNATGTPTIIQLTGRCVRAGITIDPININFGDINIGDSLQQFIRITNNGNLPLHISSFVISPTVVFSLPNGESTITLSPGEKYDLYVEFSPTAIITYTGNITLIHNAIGSPSYIPLIGRGIGPIITIEPTSINFGEIQIGRSLQRSMRITNDGSAPLVISSVSIIEDVFTLPNNESTITILPGGNQYLTIQFLPNVAIEYTGSIILTHNANSSTSLSNLSNSKSYYNIKYHENLDTINLSGNGIISDVRVSILKNYMVKPNGDVKVSVQVMDDLNEKNVKSFSFVLQYNKRILNVRDVSLGTVSNSLGLFISGSTPGELVVRVTNTIGEPLTGTGSLVDINFIGLRGDSCGTHLILESFEFNSDGPNAITENGYCELFLECGEDQTYVTTDRSTFLFQNNPNPVREGYESIIQYRVKVAGETNLIVYDILGREVAKLVNEYKSEGIYSVNFNTKNLPSGVYFYKLRAPGYEGLKKMMVIR